MSAPNFSNSPAKILVVDDLADNRDLLKAVLEYEGYSVETAADGYSAIAKIQRHQPNLLLLDLMMPELDGYDVATWVAENFPSIPILFVTAYGDRLSLEQVGGLQVSLIRKPIVFDELLEKAKALVVTSQYRRQFERDFADGTWQVGRAIDSVVKP